ncbi:PD-(D/E)XK motif protein [Nitratireductor indicus]|uniref:PD-(D/E)XK motif protein n=1 Tax=Nitratireductor indicus TaxID=721133 RepID=UPI002876845E|nr:PD-(D/E)XK motif protein [Nitratireductor indicus]MDS1135982.1 PD-(D/E)XK motif protein [Nitratireductor indicus]
MLFEAYMQLVKAFPDDCEHLFGIPIGVGSRLWLSVDQHLYPSLLFPADASDERSDIALRFIDVEFSRTCQVATEDAAPVSGTYTIVRLNEDDPEIARVFLRLLQEKFCQADRPLRNREIGDRMLEIADLFSRIENARGDVVGLWGELYIISKAASMQGAARSWCFHKSARHDFVTPSFALEVKTTLKGNRQHRFSLEQLRPGSVLDVYVASLQVVETHAGKTVSQLLEMMYEEIEDPELRIAFFNQCLIKGGRDIYRSDLRLQPLVGDDALALFDARDIPVPHIGPADPISNIRFDVDLSQAQQIERDIRKVLLAFGDDC